MQVIPPIVASRAPYVDPTPSPADTAIAFPLRSNSRLPDQELLLQGCQTLQAARPDQSETELQWRIRCRANLARKQKKIQKYETAGQLRDANDKRWWLFRAEAARVTAASRELRHYRRKHPNRPCPTLGELVTLMHDRTACYNVHVEAKLKSDGGYRPICAYGLVDRALQRTLELSYGAGITYLENQAGVKHRSMKSLIGLIDQAIRSGQYKRAVQVDINSYFSNLDPNIVGRRFGMKTGVIDRILTNREKERRGKILPRNRETHTKWNRVNQHVGRGLPQGSVASPTFAYAMLAPILQAFQKRYGSRVVVFNYCDNFLILGPSEVTVRYAVEFLSEQLSLLAECLTLKYVSVIRQLAHGIEFAGYRFKHRIGCPIVSIPISKQKAYLNELDRRFSDVCDEPTIDACLAWVKGKFAHFDPDPEVLTLLARSTFIKTKALEKQRPTLARALLPIYEFLLKKWPEGGKVEQSVLGTRRPRVNRVPRSRLNFGPTIPRDFRIREPMFDEVFKQRNTQFIGRLLARREPFISDFGPDSCSAHIGEYLVHLVRNGSPLA